jgi:rubrerythrin
MMRRFTSVLLVTAAAAVASAAAIEIPERRSSVVGSDLEAAMKGEAFAFAKYSLFAERARACGHSELATLFKRTAKVELMEHFREHAALAGLTSTSDDQNLRDALAGETYETSKMYPDMAARARQAGDTYAAERFAEIGRDEAKHRDAFAVALISLERTAGKPGA